jgi:Undecaprenyl-phosphate galactose phosphotransferase WbaP
LSPDRAKFAKGVILRMRDISVEGAGDQTIKSTLAPSLELPRRYGFGTEAGSIWLRAAVISALMLSDLLCFAFADMLLHIFGAPPALALFRGRDMISPTVVDLLLIIALIFSIVRYLAGDYSRRQLFWDGARSTTAALLISGTIYVVATVILEPVGLISAFIVWTVLLFLLPGARQLMRKALSRAGIWHLPTAIIGTSATAQEVCPVLGRQLALGLDVRWVVPESPEKHMPLALAGLRILWATPNELTAALVVAGCKQVIFVPDDRLQLDDNDLIDQFIGADIRVAIVPSLRRLPLFGLSTSYFFGKDLLLLQVRNNLARLPQRILKRTLDIVGSVAIIVLMLPLFAILAILIKLEDRGPTFFIQSRVGRNGRDFLCWKFRTMVVDAEAQMSRWAKENPVLLARYRESNFKLQADPRVTRIGTWLRRTSLDELPQLINVVLGDMSLVGPRPLIRRELPDYGAVISLYERVRPGITGLWQISGRSHTTFAERVSFDEWYIKNWTMWYDIVIVLQTFWVLVAGEGAY